MLRLNLRWIEIDSPPKLASKVDFDGNDFRV
jgi:hypothetical protein